MKSMVTLTANRIAAELKGLRNYVRPRYDVGTILWHVDYNIYDGWHVDPMLFVIDEVEHGRALDFCQLKMYKNGELCGTVCTYAIGVTYFLSEDQAKSNVAKRQAAMAYEV